MKQALISSGAGWLDADPEIHRFSRTSMPSTKTATRATNASTAKHRPRIPRPETNAGARPGKRSAAPTCAGFRGTDENTSPRRCGLRRSPFGPVSRKTNKKPSTASPKSSPLAGEFVRQSGRERRSTSEPNTDPRRCQGSSHFDNLIEGIFGVRELPARYVCGAGHDAGPTLQLGVLSGRHHDPRGSACVEDGGACPARIWTPLAKKTPP